MGKQLAWFISELSAAYETNPGLLHVTLVDCKVSQLTTT